MDPLQLKKVGFSDQDISQYTELQKAGFTPAEIADYLSKGKPAMPSPEGTITKAPPAWVPWAKTGIELAGFGLGGPLGYAGARQISKLIPGGPPRRPLMKADVEKEVGFPLTDEEFQNVLATSKKFQAPAPTEKAVGTVLGKAGEIGEDIAAGMVYKGAGELAARAIPKVLPFYARGRVPGAEEIAKIGEREGVRIPAAEITGSTGQAALASTVQKLPQTAYTMQKEAETTMSQFSSLVDRTLVKTGGRVEPFLAGQSAQEGRLIKLAESKTTGTQFYNQAKDLAKGVETSYDSLNSAMVDVTRSDAYQLLSEGSKKEVDKVISFLENKIRPEVSAKVKAGLKLPFDVEQKVLAQAGQEFTPTTYMEAEGIRKSVADKLFSKNIKGTEAYGPIQKLYDALQQDMEASAKVAGSDAHKAFMTARDFWNKNVFGTFGERGREGVMGKLRPLAEGGTSPERAVSILKSASLSDIGKIKEGLPAEQFNQFRQGLLTQIFQANSKTSPTTGEIIYNGSQIAKDLFGKSGLGEARLKTLMTPEEFTFLKEMASVGERMGSAWRIAGNPSGTAHTLYTIHLMSQVGSAVGAAVAGEEARKRGGAGAGLAVAGAFLTPYALARLITSNIGRQYLIGGFPRMEKAFGRVLPFGVIGTKGILGGPEPQQVEIPTPKVTAPMNVDKELSQAKEAISRGVSADRVRIEFKTRTGQEFPE